MPRDQIQGQNYETGIPTVNEYEFDPGVCVLPIAEDPPTDPVALRNWSPVIIARLHAPYRLRRVSHTNIKNNAPPVIPAPADSGSFVFMGGTVALVPQFNMTFSNCDWTTQTEYTFVETCVSRPQDGLILGNPPWQMSLTTENSQQYGYFSGSQSPGALKTAGLSVLSGAQVAAQIQDLNSLQGYGYNEPSFFPGIFFDNQLINGGFSNNYPSPASPPSSPGPQQ